MNFYIASSFKNIDKVRELSNQLKLEGYTHTYDWTQNENINSLEALSTIGEKEKEAIVQSDFLVILLPAGISSHVELGIAIGLGKRIYLYSPTDEIYEFEQTSTFYHIKGVHKFIGTLTSFMQELIKQEDQFEIQSGPYFNINKHF
ncbi:group-specific protein [Paenibacillus eucommiae]|uniref:Nucleoside 2-deoxyribosyltransferase n=1 Tax=Paenibacillus eucommiae TaxID=1355755 RepID=A0ABS4JAI5_9BACL|nr:group-specific protein [Paenibacillus eucommiae]MBP1996859.1 nucleoside 2-deoxyribosyltransferase [Paenibacillus eucommiae]